MATQVLTFVVRFGWNEARTLLPEPIALIFWTHVLLYTRTDVCPANIPNSQCQNVRMLCAKTPEK